MTKILDFGLNIRSFPERIQNERAERLLLAKTIRPFGVEFLDRALGGIFRNDLILIGAKTGRGKTALSTIIARSNAQAGARVHYFALEAEPLEIERRIKYGILTSLYFKMHYYAEDAQRLNFLDWYAGRLEDILGKHDALADEQLSRVYHSLFTFYKDRDFDANDMERAILSIQHDTDLVIIDHLHYVDSDDPNENRGYKIITKKIRDVALNIGKPVVVVAHVRKSDRRTKAIMPSIEDFHGSSDVPKIATKAIMIAPGPEDEGSKTEWPTYMQAVKCRFEGSRTRFVALTRFDVTSSSYLPKFQLGRLSASGEEWEPLSDSAWPRWARS